MIESSNSQVENTAIITPLSWTTALPLNHFFSPTRPLEVDIGCGKGRFLLSMARANPDINFLGIDRLLRRLKKVNKKIVQEHLANVRLLRTEASYVIEHLLPHPSVSTFYIFFPDPWPKKRHVERRLFRGSFIESLHRTLLPDGLVHLATDHCEYFEEICVLFDRDPRFREIQTFVPSSKERTDFELQFLQQKPWIGRRSFKKRVAN